MPRIPRVDVGGEIYHVINRANARLPIFFTEEDYELFGQVWVKSKYTKEGEVNQRYLTPLGRRILN